MPPRHCEPTGRRTAPPDDRLREAMTLIGQSACPSLPTRIGRLKFESKLSQRHCEEPLRRCNPSCQPASCKMDCFAEPVIGRRLCATRWLAMTALLFEN